MVYLLRNYAKVWKRNKKTDKISASIAYFHADLPSEDFEAS